MQHPSAIVKKGLLRYVKGDATLPHGGGHRMIIHVCNDAGGWGSGFVVALSKRWSKPEQQYRLWYRSQGEGRNKFRLGEIQVVDIQSELAVVNMLGQHGYGPSEDGTPPLRLDALKSCLEKVAVEAKDRNSTVHCPRIGAGRAVNKESGYDPETWEKVENLIVECLINKGINVTVYDLPEEEK